jgi:hypothetical protein
LSNDQKVAVGVSAGVLAAIIIGAVAAAIAGAIGGRKGYKYLKHKQIMTSTQSNPIYKESKET